MRDEKMSWIIGIDEVGRGALAGPVAVAALALPQNFQKKYLRQSASIKLRDSKKLSSKQREVWFRWVKNQALPHAVALVSPKIIDRINISQAANLAATKAFLKLLTNNKQLTINNCKVFLDGGLYVQNKTKLKNLKTYKFKTIIKGDEKIPAISLASIVAKVYRDKLMKKLHKKYPRYDFIHNVGYGTKKHIKAIKKYGLSSIHRRSFSIQSI